jgi:DNA-binding protein H-NS
MNLSKMNIEQLRGLIKDAEDEIKKRRRETRRETLSEIKKLAEQQGFSLNELVGLSRGPRAKRAAQKTVKYRHPEDPDKTWAGQGRQPKWIREWLASNKSLEELAVE